MILLAFIVYITVKGELPVYLSLLRGSSANGQPIAGGSAIGSLDGSVASGASSLSNAAMTAEQAGQLLDIFGGI